MKYIKIKVKRLKIKLLPLNKLGERLLFINIRWIMWIRSCEISLKM